MHRRLLWGQINDTSLMDQLVMCFLWRMQWDTFSQRFIWKMYKLDLSGFKYHLLDFPYYFSVTILSSNILLLKWAVLIFCEKFWWPYSWMAFMWMLQVSWYSLCYLDFLGLYFIARPSIVMIPAWRVAGTAVMDVGSWTASLLQSRLALRWLSFLSSCLPS